MRATADRPPRARGRISIPGKCQPPPRERGMGGSGLRRALARELGHRRPRRLRRIGRWARGEGASVLLISPLGAQPPTAHQEPCPYYSSSRRFLNPLYLRVEELPVPRYAPPSWSRCAAKRRRSTNGGSSTTTRSSGSKRLPWSSCFVLLRPAG